MSPTFYTDEEKEDIWTNEAKMNYFVLCKCMAFVGRYFTSNTCKTMFYSICAEVI